MSSRLRTVRFLSASVLFMGSLVILSGCGNKETVDEAATPQATAPPAAATAPAAAQGGVQEPRPGPDPNDPSINIPQPK